MNEAIEFADDAFPSVKAFARHMLRDDRLALRPIPGAIYAPASHPSQPGHFGIACVLFRSGCWQVELMAGLPYKKAPMHKHNRVDSVDLVLCGELTGSVAGRQIRKGRGRLLANLMTIPAGVPHGGEATGAGVVFLSFQKWQGEPTFIGLDWESCDGE